MGEHRVSVSHDLKSIDDLLSKLDFLSKSEIVFKFQVNIVVTSGDSPAHSSEKLVEHIDIETGSEVTSSDEGIANLFFEVIIVISLGCNFKHI